MQDQSGGEGVVEEVRRAVAHGIVGRSVSHCRQSSTGMVYVSS